jgi:nucleotide-binding universal stress UspA family protein
VGPRAQVEEAMGIAKKILVPVDFSSGSERAVEKAAELATLLDASIELMHVYQLPVFALPDSSITVSPTYIADLTDRAQQALNKYRDELSSRGLPAGTKLVEGMPAQAIVDHANDISAEMIVMGTHGHGGFKRFLLGSTAERVVRMATVPVLSVHLPQ